MPPEASENTEKKTKVLVIPSWSDVDFTSPSQKTYHNFTRALNHSELIQAGMIFAEMHIKQFKRKYIEVEELSYPYIGMRAWSPPKRGFLWRIWLGKYKSLFEKFCAKYWKPDIIHAHSIMAGVAAESISNEYDIPFVLTEHLSEQNLEELHPKYQKKYKEVAPQAETITSVSSGNSEYLQVKLDAEVIKIPNFIDADFFYPKQKIVDKPIFISIGEPAYTKGLDLILQSFADIKSQLPEAVLILVDKIRDRKKYVDPIIKKRNLKESVILTGIIDSQEVRKLLHSASVYISASRYESFGMSMIESISCGTPLVATETAGSIDIVNQNVGRITEQENTDEITKAILDIYTHRKNYSPKKLHTYVKENFSTQNILPQWEKVYRNV